MAGLQITATEFQQNVGRYMDVAAKRPIIITRHNTPQRVLMDMEEYMRLLERDNRIPISVAEMSENAVASMNDPNWEEFKPKDQ